MAVTTASVAARIAACTAALGLVALQTAAAATITSVVPQGEVAQVRQVVVRFDGSVVAFGDARPPDAMTVPSDVRAAALRCAKGEPSSCVR